MSVKQLVTAEELYAMPEVPGKQLELVDGEVVEMPGAGAEHGGIADTVLHLIRVFVRERNLGRTYPDNTAYTLRRDPDVVRLPDVSYVSWSKIPEGGLPERFWEVAPDLAVEIVSPNDVAVDVYRKVHEYLDAGTHMVWVLWPHYQSVTVYIGGGSIRELGPDDTLDGGNVLPGFVAPVRALFEQPRRP